MLAGAGLLLAACASAGAQAPAAPLAPASMSAGATVGAVSGATGPVRNQTAKGGRGDRHHPVFPDQEGLVSGIPQSEP
jgi:hypothetical protein